MLLRTRLSGLAAVVFLAVLAGGPAEAAPRIAPLPDLGGDPPAEAGRVVLAQAVDPRITSLEEEVRRLNGLVEELNFQMLQMQDQMRRMQEDTDFRLQQLEGTATPADAAADDERTERLAPARPSDSAPASETATAPSAQPDTSLPGVETAESGEPPRTLGTITLDENGNLVASSPDGQPVDLLEGTPAGDGQSVAALPPADNPGEAYRNAYEFILSGDYRMAEAGFRQYLDRFPDDQQAANAHFWLGEAMLGQDRYREAAEVFLNANRSFPNSEKAPEMLLKLGVSLSALNQQDVACATYTEIGHRYPDISAALQERVKQERALAGC